MNIDSSNNKKLPLTYFFALSLAIIILDQTIKLLVHFNMSVGEEFTILNIDWLKIHYTLNPGLAFGFNVDWVGFKTGLTVFRIFASGLIVIYMYSMHKKINTSNGYLWCISMILAGAIGNVIDSIFYGIFLDNTVTDAPMELFHGQVIDMFFFDIWHGYIGDYFLSIWPVFNVADSSIFLAVLTIIIFQKKLLK